MILRAHTADPEIFEAVARKLWTPFVDPNTITPTTFQAHPDAYRFEPQGARVHIAIAPTPAKLGSVWLPPQADDVNGLGIIFAVGPDAYSSGAPHPGAVTYDLDDVTEDQEEYYSPYTLAKELLYRQVMLKKYAGNPLAFDAVRGHDFYDNIITCSVRDILAIDFPENRPKGGKIDNLHNMLGQQVNPSE